MYETRTRVIEEVDVLLAGDLVATVRRDGDRLPVRYVGEGVAFAGTSPRYREPTGAVLWAIHEHRHSLGQPSWHTTSRPARSSRSPS